MKLFKITVPNSPDLLKAKGTKYWMREGAYPTPEDVINFVAATRSKPAIRLNVLSGLRSFALADAQPIISWVGLMLAFLAIVISIPIDIPLLSVVVSLAFAATFFVLLIRIADVTAEMDQRKRMAAVWLAAYEDGIRADNM